MFFAPREHLSNWSAIHSGPYHAESHQQDDPMPKFHGKLNLLTLAGLAGYSVAICGPARAQTTEPAATPIADHYSSVASLTVAQKFNYRVIQAFGVRGLLDAGVGAAIDQARNVPHEWGGGAASFGERFGSPE
jgi:hypothetical protein